MVLACVLDTLVPENKVDNHRVRKCAHNKCELLLECGRVILLHKFPIFSRYVWFVLLCLFVANLSGPRDSCFHVQSVCSVSPKRRRLRRFQQVCVTHQQIADARVGEGSMHKRSRGVCMNIPL